MVWLYRSGSRATFNRPSAFALMELGDIHWDLGQLTVRGKAGKQNRLPIPQDVGEALADYLLNGRPRCTTRRVFIRAKAPRQGFTNEECQDVI